jgi:hypothetical protein
MKKHKISHEVVINASLLPLEEWEETPLRSNNYFLIAHNQSDFTRCLNWLHVENETSGYQQILSDFLNYFEFARIQTQFLKHQAIFRTLPDTNVNSVKYFYSTVLLTGLTKRNKHSKIYNYFRRHPMAEPRLLPLIGKYLTPNTVVKKHTNHSASTRFLDMSSTKDIVADIINGTGPTYDFILRVGPSALPVSIIPLFKNYVRHIGHQFVIEINFYHMENSKRFNVSTEITGVRQLTYRIVSATLPRGILSSIYSTDVRELHIETISSTYDIDVYIDTSEFIRRFPQLTTLHISYNPQISLKVYQPVCDLKGIVDVGYTNITSLHLSHVNITNSDGIGKSLTLLGNLYLECIDSSSILRDIFTDSCIRIQNIKLVNCGDTIFENLLELIQTINLTDLQSIEIENCSKSPIILESCIDVNEYIQKNRPSTYLRYREYKTWDSRFP